MSEKFPMTPAGLRVDEGASEEAEDVDRLANSRAIEIARGHGDLSENADYSAAKEEQGLIEAKIRELEAKTRARRGYRSNQIVGFASQIRRHRDHRRHRERRDPAPTRSSASTKPTSSRAGSRSARRVARALIGKEVGDTVTVQSPKGKREVEVTKVEWIDVPPLEEVRREEARRDPSHRSICAARARSAHRRLQAEAQASAARSTPTATDGLVLQHGDAECVNANAMRDR